MDKSRRVGRCRYFSLRQTEGAELDLYALSKFVDPHAILCSPELLREAGFFELSDCRKRHGRDRGSPREFCAVVGAVDARVGEHGLASWTKSGGFGSQPFLARLSGGESRKVIDARLLRTARVDNELLKLGFPVNPPKTKRQIAGPGLPGDHMLAIAVMVLFVADGWPEERTL
jgi:hypothetical protein